MVTPTLGAVRTNAGYLLIRNDGTASDQLLGAASSAAGSIEVHASLVQDGVVRMEAVKQPITIPANSAVAFQSGGYHLMILNPARALSVGESFPLVLRFRRSGELVVSAVVAEVRASRNSTTRRSSDHSHH